MEEGGLGVTDIHFFNVALLQSGNGGWVLRMVVFGKKLLNQDTRIREI